MLITTIIIKCVSFSGVLVLVVSSATPIMLRLASSLLLSLTPVSVISQTDWCRLSPQHTMCLHQGPGPACVSLAQSGVSSKEAKTITDLHNRLNNQITNLNIYMLLHVFQDYMNV